MRPSPLVSCRLCVFAFATASRTITAALPLATVPYRTWEYQHPALLRVPDKGFVLSCTCREYDRMSAYELFQSSGVSKRLYDTFLSPMLLVTLFAPPTQLSAAAALGE